MKIKNWVVAKPDLARAQSMAQQGGFTPLAAAALCARGLCDADEVDTFLSTDTTRLQDPFRLPDMAAAVQEIRETVQTGSKITVFGDYDVDGVTATCILVDYLRSIGGNCDYYIPDRTSEGYGLNKMALEGLRAEGTQLLITVDSGITALPEIAFAKEIGLRVIVTDHHECLSELPDAVAVVDPKRDGSSHPFAELSGVGVAFKLICALSEDTEDTLRRYAGLTALGTVADVMPIVGENRVIVAAGLQNMQHPQAVGLKMLLREIGQEGKKPTSSTISFMLAPRINAAGRLGQAKRAAELFLTQDEARAQTLAAWLCEQNKNRQVTEAEILENALAQLRKEYDPVEDKIIVLSGENWHSGVIGIVCSRICDLYSCPVFLIAMDGDIGKGSGRSMAGFNLFEALCACDDLLDKYGGHELAAGLTVHREHLQAFKQRIKDYAKERIDPVSLRATLHIDSMITPAWISEENVVGLQVLEPYGSKNPQPIFAMENMMVEEITPISSDRHVRLTLSREGNKYTALLFGTGAGGCGFAQGNEVDAAFYLEINSFRGRTSVQMVVQDVRLSQSELLADQRILSLYNRCMNDQPLTKQEAQVLMPERQDLVAVWRHIISRAQEGQLCVPSNALSRRVQWESKRAISIGKVLVCLDVFSESALLSYHFRDGLIYISLKHYQGKADISRSVVLATLRSMSEN